MNIVTIYHSFDQLTVFNTWLKSNCKFTEDYYSFRLSNEEYLTIANYSKMSEELNEIEKYQLAMSFGNYTGWCVHWNSDHLIIKFLENLNKQVSVMVDNDKAQLIWISEALLMNRDDLIFWLK